MENLTAAILAGLGTLDVDNDDHWTNDGLPRMDVVEDIVGKSLTRADITGAAKGFNRKNPTLASTEDADDVDNIEVNTLPETATDSTPILEEDAVENEEPIHAELVYDPATEPRTAEDETPLTVSVEDINSRPELEQAAAELNAKRDALVIAQRAYTEAQKRHDTALVAAMDEPTAESTAATIKQYQESQLKLAQEAHDRSKGSANNPAV